MLRPSSLPGLCCLAARLLAPCRGVLQRPAVWTPVAGLKCLAACPCSAEKGPADQLFDAMDATDLNKRLKDLMDGLSVKVGHGIGLLVSLCRVKGILGRAVP